MVLSELSRRDRKAAQTRDALLRALIQQLASRSFKQVRVRDLCDQVDISEPTFYNHFESKGALLTHFVSLWSLRAAASLDAPDVRDSGVVQLFVLFDSIARGMRRHPGLLTAIFCRQMPLRRQPECVPIPAGDRLLWYGDNTPLIDVAPTNIPTMIAGAVATGRSAGEIPESVDRRELRRVILSLFYGVPTAEERTTKISTTFANALRAVLTGYRIEVPEVDRLVGAR